MRTKMLSVPLLILLLATSPAIADEGQLTTGRPSGFFDKTQAQPLYRSNFYNYPHALGSDYVFRTERVFSPEALQSSWFDRLGLDRLSGLFSGGKKQAALRPGEELDRKIGQLAENLAKDSRAELDDGQAVAVSTFVNLGNLYRTSSLGRYLSEKLVNGLQQAGLEVVEVRKTPGLMLSRNHGEFGLSRDMDELSFAQPLQALVTGTYTVAGQEVLISARIVRNQDNRILASANLALPINTLISTLLADEGSPAVTRTTSLVGIRAHGEEKSSAAPMPAPPSKGKKK